VVIDRLIAQGPNPTVVNGDPLAPLGSVANLGLAAWKNDLAQQAGQALNNIVQPQRSTVRPDKYGVGEKTGVLLGMLQPHPFDRAASDAKRALKDGLTSLGYPAKVVQQMGESLGEARVTALDTAQAWQHVSQAIPVTRNSLTRTYTSEIVPARGLGGAVGRSYATDGLHGVSAGNRAQPDHARNLQVSRLTGTDPVTNQPKTLSQSVRHGVIDAC
jgi:hypothetical protein